MEKAPCKRWEIANVFHRIEKSDVQMKTFLLCSLIFIKKVRTKKCIVYLS